MNPAASRYIPYLPASLFIFLWLYSNLLPHPTGFLTAIPATATFIFVFIASGFGATLLAAKLFTLRLDFSEFILLSICHALFFPPSLITLIYLAYGSITPTIVYLVYFLFVIPPFFLPFSFKNVSNINTWRLFVHPVAIAALVVLIVHLISLSFYSFLPFPDPYSWTIEFDKSFSVHQLYEVFSINRVAFSALIYSAFTFTGLPVFSLFKWFFPFISLLSLAPLWVFARHLSTRLSQTTTLLTALFSPVLVFEFEIVRHQIIFQLFLFFYLALIYLAYRSKSPAIFNLSGLFSFLGIFFHPAFQIVFLAWSASWLLIYRRRFNQHPLASLFFLAGAALFLHWTRLTDLVIGISRLSYTALLSFFQGRWNLSFPAQYTNYMGVESGWPGWSGVMKFYAFYAGPAAPLLILGSLFLLLNSRLRKKYLPLAAHPWLISLTLLFLFFLTLAELTPRFSQFVHLPDRAWLYLDIMLIPLVPILIVEITRRYQKAAVFLLTIFILFSLASASAALYVNFLNGYTIPDYEFQAAGWIRQNLPPRPIIFASSSKNLLIYHAQALRISTEHNLLELPDPLIILKTLNNHYRKTLKLGSSDPPFSEAYLYYAKTHPLNPFASRRSGLSYAGNRNLGHFPPFGSFPDHYELIYQDDNNVLIWRVRNTPSPSP